MDKLFATLDPTMRALDLPTGKVILSDTVGFVSDLPTELVAAFRATLEEVLEADVLLHVRDISHPDTLAQKQDVESVLRSLFRTDALPENIVEVCNKCDKLDKAHKEALANMGALSVSAVSGEGLPALLTTIEQKIAGHFFVLSHYTLPAANGKALSWLHANGKVLEQQTEDEYIHVSVYLSAENCARFDRTYGNKK